MLSVTVRARQQLKKILSGKTANPAAGLRLASTTKGKWGLSVDVQRPGDKIVEESGIMVLMIDNTLAISLDGITIDVKDTPEGARLVVKRPRT